MQASLLAPRPAARAPGGAGGARAAAAPLPSRPPRGAGAVRAAYLESERRGPGAAPGAPPANQLEGAARGAGCGAGCARAGGAATPR
jgi:hypothetical protein